MSFADAALLSAATVGALDPDHGGRPEFVAGAPAVAVEDASFVSGPGRCDADTGHCEAADGTAR